MKQYRGMKLGDLISHKGNLYGGDIFKVIKFLPKGRIQVERIFLNTFRSRNIYLDKIVFKKIQFRKASEEEIANMIAQKLKDQKI